MNKLTALWRRVPKPVRAGWITAWITFVGVLLSTLTGLLPALMEFISTGNEEAFFQRIDSASTVVVGAAIGFVVGCLNAAYRWLKPIEESYRTQPPG